MEGPTLCYHVLLFVPGGQLLSVYLSQSGPILLKLLTGAPGLCQPPPWGTQVGPEQTVMPLGTAILGLSPSLRMVLSLSNSASPFPPRNTCSMDAPRKVCGLCVEVPFQSTQRLFSVTCLMVDKAPRQTPRKDGTACRAEPRNQAGSVGCWGPTVPTLPTPCVGRQQAVLRAGGHC